MAGIVDNLVGQTQPVVIMGVQSASGGIVEGGLISKQYTSATNSLLTSAGASFNVVAGRKALIQNQSTTALYVKLGPNVVAGTDFSFVLSACTAQDDGLGGSKYIDDYAGVVTVAAASVRAALTLFS